MVVAIPHIFTNSLNFVRSNIMYLPTHYFAADNDEETVDMDELQKQQDTDIDDDAEAGPDQPSDDDDSDVEEVEGPEIDED